MAKMEVLQASAALARAAKTRDPDLERHARQTLAEAKIEQAIQRELAKAPPLRPEQIDRIVQVLNAPARAQGGGSA